MFSTSEAKGNPNIESPHEHEALFFTRMRKLLAPDERVRRFKVGGGWFVLQKDKLVAKGKDGWHTTIYYDSKRKVLGAHRTKEGTTKQREMIAEYDISKLNPGDYDRIFRACWRWVNLGDPHFKDLRIEVPRERRDFSGLHNLKPNRTSEIGPVVARRLSSNMKDLTLEQFANATGNDSAEGIVFRQDSPVGFIYWTPWKALIYCDFELHHRMKNELLRKIVISPRINQDS